MNASIWERSEKLVNGGKRKLSNALFLRSLFVKSSRKAEGLENSMTKRGHFMSGEADMSPVAMMPKVRPAQSTPQRYLSVSALELAILRQCNVTDIDMLEGLRQMKLLGKPLSLVLTEQAKLSTSHYYFVLAGKLNLRFAQTGALRVACDALFSERPRRIEGLLLVPARDANERLVLAAAPIGAQVDVLARVASGELGKRYRMVVVTPSELRRLVYTGHSTAALAEAGEEYSAQKRLSSGQKTLFSFTGLVPIAAFFTIWHVLGILSLFVKLLAIALGVIRLSAAQEHKLLGADEEPSVPIGPLFDLPRYTVLVPLYDEDAVCEQLVRSMSRLDYPKNRLEILFLTEQDDTKTRTRLNKLIEPHMKVIALPDGRPRTKPRALGVGLQLARGDLITVFDAEDRPDADQLKRAAAAFAQAPDTTACLQASLFIDHAQKGWLLRQFAFEYAALFDVILPWFSRRGVLLPLGGTSNHFRVAALKDVGGWDPFNVTEDADLGVRLARKGYQVKTLSSTTREEAPLTVKAWVAQRTRWHKGWMQTAVVHLRDPWRLWQELGVKSAAVFYLWLVGGLFCLLVAPWTIVAACYVGYMVVRDGISSAILVFLGTLGIASFLISLGGSILSIWRGANYRGFNPTLFEMLTIPAYWLLGSWACYKAAIEFWWRPHHWRKTSHGHIKTDGNQTDAPSQA
ncbi:glycosyltransferase [Pseudovibrio sp. SPO723]|uniref:glycosyltransferase n=1 Tax=Nesiotobacter zosterae TaxID=392721 RepID=UPI0029C4811A|nr:glycosyltransferase [Pseudovibrio sp. SPO723]MDX5593156.1 glycosyltransferase [Pseudovibrio sp. SPO723]